MRRIVGAVVSMFYGSSADQENDVEPQASFPDAMPDDNATGLPNRQTDEVQDNGTHTESCLSAKEVNKNPGAHDDDAGPQPSFPQQISKESPVVLPKCQTDKVEDKSTHINSHTESSPSAKELPLKAKVNPEDQDDNGEPKPSFSKPISDESPTVPSKCLPDDVGKESSPVKSDKELSGNLVTPKTRKITNLTAQEQVVEQHVNSAEPKTDKIPQVVPKHLRDEIKAKSHHLKTSKEPLPVYQVPLEEEQINISGCRRFIFGKDEVHKTNRTIMVMGATGAGKSTLIDGMINYILEVQREDGYRFKLVKEVQRGTQAMSQTTEVTVYKLNYQDGFQIDYSLTIIDTPGFGDTRGIKRDMEITEQIRNLFTSTSGQVFELDAVCFVVQAALARLTPSQKYVFDSVLSIFGKDIADNIRVLVTFADGKRPPVLEAITASGVPCPEEKGAPLHFKFNNSALFSNNNSQTKDEDEEDDEEDFDEMFWKMGQKSMKRFFVALNKIPTKSLRLTKEVLTERKQLENLVENLRKQVRVGLTKLEEIRQTSDILQTHQAEISRNANFEFEVKVIEPLQILKKENTFITNCQQCSYTCHKSCAYANDVDKIKCCAIGIDGKCTVCPNKCIWTVHFNQKYTWEYKEVTKKETIQELKEKYEVAKGEKNTVEILMTKLEDEYEDVQVEVTVMMDESSACLNKLKDIALKPDPLSTPDYIDMLIEGEKAEVKPGWQARVESLMGMKETAEYMAKVGRKEVLLEKGKRVTLKKQSFMTRMFAKILRT